MITSSADKMMRPEVKEHPLDAKLDRLHSEGNVGAIQALNGHVLVQILEEMRGVRKALEKKKGG